MEKSWALDGQRPMSTMHQAQDTVPGPNQSGHIRPSAGLDGERYGERLRPSPSAEAAGQASSVKSMGSRVQGRKSARSGLQTTETGSPASIALPAVSAPVRRFQQPTRACDDRPYLQVRALLYRAFLSFGMCRTTSVITQSHPGGVR
jgi:hypothetical protein